MFSSLLAQWRNKQGSTWNLSRFYWRWFVLILFMMGFMALWKTENRTASMREILHELFFIPPSDPPPVSKLRTRKSWKAAKVPDFCKKILSNPKMYSRCDMDSKTKLCRNGEAEMFSQFFQDYYLYTRHFSKLKRRGVYVDLAAKHPWVISNTYFMDKCLGWDGICIEPYPSHTETLKQQRGCTVVPKCISNRDGDKISFVLHDNLSGSSKTNKFMEKWRKEGKEIKEVPMKCTSLRKLFKVNMVRIVDYFSLDVEGHEMMALRGINWREVKINVITIELSPNTTDVIDTFMRRKGYSRHIPNLNNVTRSSGLLNEDAIFIRNDVVFGEPM